MKDVRAAEAVKSVQGKTIKLALVELVVLAVVTSIALFSMTYLAYSDLATVSDAEYINYILGATPFFRLVYAQLHVLSLERIPVLPLLLFTPMISIFVFSLWVLARKRFRRGQVILMDVGSWTVLQFPLVLSGLLIEYSMGLPVGQALLGSDMMASPYNLSIYELLIVVLIEGSMFLSAVGRRGA